MAAPQADAPGRGAAKPRRNAGKRACLIAAYREGLELGAVLLVAGADVLRVVAAGHDGEAALETAETVTARWWCRRRSEADRIVAAVRLTRATSAAQAHESVARAAKRLGVSFSSDEEIAEEAMRAIARLDAEVERQMQTGALKSVNKSYRAYRLEASGRGESVLRYADWMERYKAKLVRDIAANLRLL
ncbi:MAG TPA: hypothetical protein VGH13_22055 [Xanthobacteraceae bacterium]|jgi:hypothetical protein